MFTLEESDPRQPLLDPTRQAELKKREDADDVPQQYVPVTDLQIQGLGTKVEQRELMREPPIDLEVEALPQHQDPSIVQENIADLEADVAGLIQDTNLVRADADEQTRAIVETFNHGNPESFMTNASVATFLGQQIEPNQFKLIHRNNVPELVPFSNIRQRLKYYMTGKTEELGIYEKNAQVIGKFGRYVVNVKPGTFLKIFLGNDPVLLKPGPHVIRHNLFRLADNPEVRVNENYINHGNIHIIRVPVGKLAKISIAGKPMILPPRDQVYVFNSPLFKFHPVNQQKKFVDVNDAYIQHGMLHILRVPQGKIAKIMIDGRPQFLVGSDKPYYFKSATFSLVPARGQLGAQDVELFEDVNTPYIKHGTHYLLRVPKGKIAKVWVDGIPQFLTGSDKPYHFESSTFNFEPKQAQGHRANEIFEDASAPYIKHGTLHILRVPRGKIAKVWIDNQPQLLEYQDKPYTFDNPTFLLDPKQRDPLVLFEDEDAELICHGSLKRLLPRTGSVAVTYDAGKLVIIPPSDNGKPILIEKPTHTVKSFLFTGTTNLMFPSKRAKEERAKEFSDRAMRGENEDFNFERFTTADASTIGVKLLVVYTVTDPETLLSGVQVDHISDLIERTVVADMTRAVQGSTSMNYSESESSRIPEEELKRSHEHAADTMPSAPRFFKNILDQVTTDLRQDLAKYGINLVRVNFEETKIIERSEQSEKTQQLSASVANADRETQIMMAEARRQAGKQTIETDQVNAMKIKASEAELQQAELAAKASLVAAEAENQRIRQRAEAEAYAAQIKMEAELRALMLRANIYQKCPMLFELELARIQAHALSGLKTQVVSPEIVPGNLGVGTRNALFASRHLPHDLGGDVVPFTDEEISAQASQQLSGGSVASVLATNSALFSSRTPSEVPMHLRYSTGDNGGLELREADAKREDDFQTVQRGLRKTSGTVE